MPTTKAYHVRVGFFVLGALALLILGVIAFGGGSLLRKPVLMETYIDESVQGLDVGSAVKFRGVKIGSVQTIGFVNQAYTVEATTPAARRARRYVRLVLAVDEDYRELLANPNRLKEEINAGLRVRTASSGLTGMLYMELDHVNPAEFQPLPIFWEPTYAYVPSRPNLIATFMDELQRTIVRFESMDLETALAESTKLMSTAREQLAKSDWPKLSREATALASELRTTNQKVQTLLDAPETRQMQVDGAAAVAHFRKVSELLEKDLPNLSLGATATMRATSDAAKQVQETLDSGVLQQAAASFAQVAQGINRTVQTQQQAVGAVLLNVQHASDQLNELLNLTRAYPASLLLGAPHDAVSGDFDPQDVAPATERKTGSK